MKTIIEFIKENKSVIDNKYFKVFWKVISQKEEYPNVNGNWIYLSPEMITKDMGYKKVSTFYSDTLYKFYTKDTDYVEIKKNDDLVKAYTEYKQNLSGNGNTLRKKVHTGGKAQKYYKVTSTTFKIMLLRCRTAAGLSICKYYIDLEKIFISYLHYQCRYHNLNINVEIDDLSDAPFIADYSSAIRNQEFKNKLQELYRIGYVYYIREEFTKNVKIGYTFNLDERLSQLQTANSQQLSIIKYEKCIFPQIREKQLHKQYKKYHIRGEWFKDMLPYDL